MRTILLCAAGALALSVAGNALAREQSPSQSQSPPASSQAAPKEPKPAPPAKKVWTNDDIDALREHGGGVSVVGSPAPAPTSAGPAANGATPPATPEKKPPLPNEKNPEWYRKQLAPLHARLDALTGEIANAESAVSGDTRGSATVSMTDIGAAATPQQQVVQLQQQQQLVQSQIDALEDMARQNGLEPGDLR